MLSDALKSMVWCNNNVADEAENADAEFLAEAIFNLLQDFWDSKLDFAIWKKGIVAPVPKYETSWTQTSGGQINPIIRDHGLEPQCGSLNSKDCPDAIFSLRSALQICRKHGLTTH
eukprot:8589994-Ditylum_brightwellii.AAC.1